MDLATIATKFINRDYKEGDYKDPWEFIDDVRLMFDNAWLYNGKASLVYKACTKVWIPSVASFYLLTSILPYMAYYLLEILRIYFFHIVFNIFKIVLIACNLPVIIIYE